MRAKRKRKQPAKKKFVRYGHRSQKRLLEITGVYLMGNFPFGLINKFGVSDKTDQRVKDVSDTTPGEVFLLLTFAMPYGYEVEQFIHTLYRFQNFHFWTGSGRTEWFFVFSPIVGTLHLLGCWYFGIDQDPRLIGLAYFTPFIWWDAVLWLLIFRVMGVIIVSAIILFLVFAIANIKT